MPYWLNLREIFLSLSLSLSFFFFYQPRACPCLSALSNTPAPYLFAFLFFFLELNKMGLLPITRVLTGGGRSRELPVPRNCRTGTKTQAPAWAGLDSRVSASLLLGRFGPGKSRPETSALWADQWGGQSRRRGPGRGGDESGRPWRLALLDWPRGVLREGLQPGPAWLERKNQAWAARLWPVWPDDDPGVRPARDPRGRGRGRPITLARRARPPEAHGRLLPASAAAPYKAGGFRGPPRRPPLPCRSPGSGGRRGDPGSSGRRGRRAGRRTMRPALNCAARVGPDGARVAECVCVRLSVNADRPQPIGQTPPASPPTATAHWAV